MNDILLTFALITVPFIVGAYFSYCEACVRREARAQGLTLEAYLGQSDTMRQAAKAAAKAHATTAAKVDVSLELNGSWAAELAISPDSDLDLQACVTGLDDMGADEVAVLIANVEVSTGFTFVKVLTQWDSDGGESLGYKLEGQVTVDGFTFPTELVIRNEYSNAPAQLVTGLVGAAERDAIRDAKRFYRGIGGKHYKGFKQALDRVILDQSKGGDA